MFINCTLLLIFFVLHSFFWHFCVLTYSITGLSKLCGFHITSLPTVWVLQGLWVLCELDMFVNCKNMQSTITKCPAFNCFDLEKLVGRCAANNPRLIFSPWKENITFTNNKTQHRLAWILGFHWQWRGKVCIRAQWPICRPEFIPFSVAWGD